MEKTIDPVCGMSVDPARAAGRFEHRGRTYHFCSPHCLESFRKDPARFLAPAPPAPPSPAPPSGGDGFYTCPMHPEVVQDGPGACPICGMALEPRLPTLDDAEDPELGDMRRRFRVAALLTLPVFLLAMGEMLPGPLAHALPGRLQSWIELLLSAPVVLWAGWPFFHRMWTSFATRRLNMFTLIGVGTGTAFGYSLVATLFPASIPESFRGHGGLPERYFEAAAVITTLVLLGQVLELKARGRASGAIKALLGLQPRTARRIRDGQDEDVAIEQVVPGDLLRLRPGERVPVDGVVVEGRSAVDESMMTGESLPVARAEGDRLTGGTLNGGGALVLRAERVGADTLLARIVRTVAEAQRARAPIQRLADRVSAYFVVAVLAAAAAAFAAWALLGPEPRLAHALVAGVSVLIIACPCALGLATPMSIMVGVGRAATLGVLFRNAESLELLARVDTLVVDKTGTLTEGHPRLVSSALAPGFDEAGLLPLVAALERRSEHPLAAAFTEAARERGIRLAEPEEFLAVPGRGVRGKVGGHDVAAGSLAFLEDLAVSGAAALVAPPGRGAVFVALDGKAAGVFAIDDPVKSTTPEALRLLREEGLEVIMASGDNAAAAGAVGRALGIARIEAGVSPAAKAALVRSLASGGRVVAMAGDGVNDAPALAAAAVGIAMGRGTDVAMETAGITLVRGDLRGIARARELARLTMRNIRQNLFFAFLYNALGVPLAAGVLYPAFGFLLSPMIAALAMSLSSVTVIANALRLRAQSGRALL